MKRLLLLACVPALASAGDLCDVRLKGYVADRLEGCIRNHVLKTDATYLSQIFCYQEDVGNWQTEFWGKYMHSAAPFWRYTRDATLKARMDESTRQIVGHQLPDGYIGNYRAGDRAGAGWDVWGNKYTMLGLLHYHAVTGDPAALEAAKKLCDYLIATFGPGKKELHRTGCWRGLPSGSILEPVVLLYNVTKERRYLDFATYVVSELNDADSTARLIRDADVPVAARVTAAPGENFWVKSSRKAYEMMSCYQGLLEYAAAAGRKDCLEAAVKTAKSIAETEINIAGGGSCHENWYGGAARQTRTYEYEQETCVLTTWLRLCQKILEVTGDSRWADEMEKTFYNAYLASLRRDGGAFVQYNALCGHRHLGENHCRLHTNCCNANGPRGFLAFLEAFLQAAKDEVRLNFYSSGTFSAKLASGETVTLEGYTEYPKFSEVSVRNRSAKEMEFALSLRLPAWCEKPSVAVNGEKVGNLRPGTYCTIRRRWKPGDQISLDFPMPVKLHRLDGAVAFTAGPIVLARDLRFGDGPIDATVRADYLADGTGTCACFRPIRTDSNDMWITYAGDLTLGVHYKNLNERLPSVVRFCDFASAGDTWETGSAYRVWLPVVLPLPEHG